VITKSIISKLDADVLADARFVALRIEDFWMPFLAAQYFRSRRALTPQPVFPPSADPRLSEMYERLHLLLEQTPLLELLVFVLEDERASYPADEGVLKLTHLGVGPEVLISLRERCEGLEALRPACPSPMVAIRQASRAGQVVGMGEGMFAYMWAEWAKGVGLV